MTNLNMISSPSVIASVAFYFAIVGSSYVSGFSVANLKTNTRQHKCSSIELRYRSLHHGPDIEPASEEESYEYTKMSKDKIDRFGPGDFDQFGDFPADQFDGGDSEMGLSGDGTMGLQKLGRDVSPHLARTLAAKIYSEEIDQGAAYNEMSYADELMQANPTMDAVRAQQYESWAMQNEISSANRYMNEKTQSSHSSYVDDTYNYDTMDEATFSAPIEAGEELEGLITLTAPVNGIARHDIVLKNPYMGFAKFRTYFLGDEYNEWCVTPSNWFLKQKEETEFAISYKPRHPGVSVGYLVIETEDFKKTWKIVGSTGEHEF